MSKGDFGQLSLKDRLLARPQRIWQATPHHLRPALGVIYYAFLAVLLRGLAKLISAAFGETSEFRLDSTLFGVIVVSALISALVFGLVRARLPDGMTSPWLLGQLGAWVFWLTCFACSILELMPPRSDTPLEIVLTPTLLGLLLGVVFWSIRRKRHVA